MQNQVYPEFIVVTGPIASGKSTLAEKLAAELGYAFIPEEFEDNPHLEAYHRGEGSFLDAQLWFLERDTERHRRAQEILATGKGVVFDKPVHGNLAFINVTPLSNAEEMQCMDILVDTSATLRPPDLIIDISISPELAVERVAERGRNIEGPLTEKWFNKFNQCHQTTLPLWPEVSTMNIVAGERNYRDEESAVTALCDEISMLWRQERGIPTLNNA